ncbi:MAG: hypothetical protein KF862_07200 [Chitinophagaceae bacterium]|nr:hypothetical protein [Chitinophagaceae bacterium]
MSDERIDSIVNRAKVKSDLDFLDELLSSVMSKIEKINNIKISVDGGKGLADVGKQAQAAAQSTEQLVQATGKLQVAENAISQTLDNLDQKWKEQTNSLRENIKLQILHESELKKIKELIKESNAAIESTGSSYSNVSQRILSLKQRESELKNAISEVSLAIKSQIKETQAAEGSYDQMNQELGQMRDLFRQISADERNGAFGAKLKQNITVLDAELKKIDASLGNFQRNVGNYKSGWNGLGNSINQITRELPAFTMSMQTGFLAISNNLPILFDEISKTKKEIAAMRAEGQKVPGLFKQLATSIISWGTALSVGVTLLTVYGKDIANFFIELFKGREKVDKFKLEMESLNEAYANGDYKKAIQNFYEIEVAIEQAKKGVIDKTEAVNIMNKSLNLAKGEVNNLKEAEQWLIDNKKDYLDMMLQKSLANAFFAKAAEESAKAATAGLNENVSTFEKVKIAALTSLGLNNKALGVLIKAQKEGTEEVKKDANDRKKIYEEMGKDAFAAFKGLEEKLGIKTGNETKAGRDKIFSMGDDIRKAQYEVQQRFLEDMQKQNDQIVKDDNETYKRRKEAAEKYLAVSLALKKLEYNFNLGEINTKEQQDKAVAEKDYKNIKEREKAIQYITDAAAAKRKANLAKYDSEEAAITDNYRTNYINKLLDFLKKEEDARIKHEDNLKKLASGDLKNQYDARLATLDKQYGQGLISEDQYNKKRLIAQFEYGVKSLRQEIEFAEQRLAIQRQIAEGSGDMDDRDKVFKMEQDLSVLRIALEQKVADFKISQNKRGNDAIRKNIEELATYSKYAVDMFGQIGDFLSIRYEKEKNRLQEQIDLIEKKRDTEIEAIRTTTASEQEKAALIAQINATADAKKTQLEQRQRLAQQKQARFDKALNIATIVQETAVAVIRALGMKPYSPANIAMAAAVGAMGAAKLAVAAATPIPQYAEGVGVDDNKSHPGGLAVVGDGGKKELVVTPGGKSFITPDKSTLVNLPKGTKVFPDANEVMEVAQTAAFKQLPVQNVKSEKDYTKEMIGALLGEIAQLRETVKNKETIQLNATRAGLSAMHKQHNNFWEYIGSNIR